MAAVRGSQHFTKAEHFAAERPADGDSSTRAVAALDAVAAIGSDGERDETARHLMEEIAASLDGLLSGSGTSQGALGL